MTTKQETAQRIRQFAKEKFGTIKGLANELGMSDSALHTAYLSGRSMPGGEFLIKLNQLGCDILWLLTGIRRKTEEMVKEDNDEPKELSSPIDIDKIQVGKRLREFGQKKFGQLKILAAHLDMSPQSLSTGYLSGRSLPGAELLLKLSQMGCDITWLLTGNNKKTNQNKTENYSPHKKLFANFLNNVHNRNELAKFGERLKQLGIEKYGRLDKFAEELGIAPPALSRYISDKVEPKASFLIKLQELGCDVMWLLTGQGSSLGTMGEEVDAQEETTKIKKLGDRLKEFGITKFGSISAFAKALGMKPPSLYKYLNGNQKPGADFIFDLIQLGCDAHWLITGERNMGTMGTLGTLEEGQKGLEGLKEKKVTAYGFDYPLVQRIKAGAHANYDDGMIEYIHFPYTHKDCVALRVNENSMIPMLQEHDLVLVDLVKRPEAGDIVAVRTKAGEQYIKRLMVVEKAKKLFHLYSLNPAYPIRAYGFDEVETVKKVVMVLKEV